MLDYIKKLITPDMVSFWVPSGQNRAMDLIRGNHGKVIGAHPNVPTIAPPIDQIADCDATTDWTGTALTIDTVDKKEGTGSLKDTIATPVVDTTYTTTYNPAGTWDWSGKKHILFWLKCDRANTAFTYVRFVIRDTLANWRQWNLTFSAGEWTAVKKLLSIGDAQSATPPNLALIADIYISFQAADTTPFYKKIDDVRVTGNPSVINPSVGWVFGGDDYIDCGNDKSLDITDELTIGAWAYLTTTVGARIIAKQKSNSMPTWELYTYTSGAYFRVLASAPNTYKTVNVGGIPICNWYRVVGVYNKTNLKIYLNSKETIGEAHTSNILSGAEVELGRRRITAGTYDGYFNGYQALPFVVKGAWSQAQVANDYLNTKGLFAPRG